MMAVRAVTLAGALGLSLGMMSAARATELVPAGSVALEERFAAYDPAAVVAARHYDALPSTRGNIIKIVENTAFSTRDVVALDKFHSTPEGVSIVAKLPPVAARLPGIFQAIFPDLLAEMKVKLKTISPEVKL